MPTITTVGKVDAGAVSNNDNTAVAGGLPVDLSASTWRTVYRVVWPVGCVAGDVFRVHGEASVTNDVGREMQNGKMVTTGTRYTVGVGFHLRYYDVDYEGPLTIAERMIKVGNSEGENVTVDLHHLPLDITRWMVLPSTWVAGHRPVLVLTADAHSTGWELNDGDDVLTVDNHGQIEAFRWTAPPTPDPMAALAAQVNDLSEDLGIVNATITDVQTAVETLTGRVDAHVADETLEARVDVLAGRMDILAARVDALTPDPEPCTPPA